MRSLVFALKGLAAMVLLISCSSFACAQTDITFVSAVGSDANSCARNAPCLTFSGAQTKTSAGGEIHCLDPGGFGAVVITKSLTIDCGSGVGSILITGTNAIIVNAGVNDIVYIRNLSIGGLLGNGSGAINAGINGVRYLAGKALFLQHVAISGFNTYCVDASGTATGELVIEDSNLSNCRTAGVNATTSAGNMEVDLHRVHIWDVGAGISAGNGARVDMRDSVIAQVTTGVSQPSSPSLGSIVMVQGSTISFADTALKSNLGTFIGAAGNNFFGNALVYSANGGNISTGNDNTSFGNGSDGSATGTLPAS